jgi:raffinose/stachyose/melibiose transport system substrate-binding protein
MKHHKIIRQVNTRWGKRAMAAGAAVLTLFGSVGAGVTTASSAGAATKVTGTLSVLYLDGERNPALWVKMFKKEYPGVTVNVSTESNQAKTGEALITLTSPNPPDVAFLNPNTTVYFKLLAAHDLAPLTSVWDADNLGKAYGASVSSAVLVKGVPYVLPFDETYYNIVYYNIDLFKKLGIAQPPNHRFPSFAALFSAASTLQKAGYSGLAMAGTSGYQATWLVDTLLDTAATPAQYANYLQNYQTKVPIRVSYTSQPFIRALEAENALAQHKIFQPGFMGVNSDGPTDSMFAAGRAGMLLDGEYTVAGLQQDGMKFHLGWALLPPVPGSSEQNVPSLFIGDAFAVPAKAANTKLAQLFLDLVMSEEGQAANLTVDALPVTDNVPSSNYSGLGPVVDSQVAFVGQYGGQLGWSGYVPYQYGETFSDPLVQEMLDGTLTPAKVAAKVQAAFEAFKSGQ